MYRYCFEQLEQIIRSNLKRRGMEEAFLEGDLRKAAESLMKGDTVLIVTGFAIKVAMAGETDGPIGAVSLAGALEQLGKRVVLVTDVYSQNILAQCSAARGVRAPIEAVGHNSGSLRALLEAYKPSHLVAIERPGRAVNGRCYSMRGEDLSDIIPNVDELFEEAKKIGVITIGIGDGGNEIGMGKIRSCIVNSVYRGELICAAFASDFLIVAGVSNWGGHAVASALSILTQSMLLHDLDTEIAMLRRMIEAGAVDGCTKKRTMTVDGLSLEENLNIFLKLKNVAVQAIQHTRNELAPTKI